MRCGHSTVPPSPPEAAALTWWRSPRSCHTGWLLKHVKSHEVSDISTKELQGFSPGLQLLLWKVKELHQLLLAALSRCLMSLSHLKWHKMLHFRAAVPCELSVDDFHHDLCPGKQHPSSLTPGPQSLGFYSLTTAWCRKANPENQRKRGETTLSVLHTRWQQHVLLSRGELAPPGHEYRPWPFISLHYY